MGHPKFCGAIEECGSRLCANAHISESRCGAPGFVVVLFEGCYLEVGLAAISSGGK